MSSYTDTDVEGGDHDHLYNEVVSSYSWSGCSVHVKDRKSKGPKAILDDVEGLANAGELLALMGPSGSGKTTLLNLLARRVVGKDAKTEGEMLVNSAVCSSRTFRAISSYVEQDDALIGSLTARETVEFAARMAPKRISSPEARKRLVDNLLAAFGMTSSADVLVGTPVRKGLSGGQKRRISVASQLVTAPKLLFLDECTSGLDSTASFETMRFIREITKRFRLIVICSIHQPSTSTFDLFDTLCLLGGGRVCYFGPVHEVHPYFGSIGFPIPQYVNPAEYLLEVVNVDFSYAAGRVDDSADTLSRIHRSWADSPARQELRSRIQSGTSSDGASEKGYPPRGPLELGETQKSNFLVPVLLHRMFIKSYRDVFVYGLRLAMYFGLALMMGTVWVRLQERQEYIQPYINALFFGSAFMSFMAIAGTPAYLEDFAVFRKDRANGLYGAAQFNLANFLIGLPYLFGISVVFSLISYWLSNFRNSGSAFFVWIGWLFADLVAAEALVVLLSSLFPVFVIALALIAFANGLWMCVGGFLIPLPALNAFYKYVFHYIDYQAYVFQGMMVNEFKDRSYACAPGCKCMYDTGDLQCRIPGTSVLEAYGYPTNRQGEWVGIMISIIVVYRLLCWFVIWIKKH